MSRILFFLIAFTAPFNFLFSEVTQVEGKGFLEIKDGQTILHVEGTPYEMGYQHGKLLKNQIQQNIKDYIDTPQPSKFQGKVSSFISKLPDILSFIPEEYKEELKGLSDGAEIPLEKAFILNLFPEMFHCSAITATDQATHDHSLYHVRVLDYGMGKNLQNTATLIVATPDKKNCFINISYAGFIGSVTGMNDQKISIGQIGGWGYGFWDGTPMTFIIRSILENCGSLEEAKQHLQNSSRTCEYYYIIADGKTNQSFASYATHSQIHFIEPGTNYAMMAPDNLPKNFGENGDHDKFFLNNYSEITSSFQTVIKSEIDRVCCVFFKQPQDTLLLTGYTHEYRYPTLAQRVSDMYGKLTVADLIEIIKYPVAMKTNLHNAIFHPETLTFWVAHAGKDGSLACDEKYHYFQMKELLSTPSK